MLATPKPGSLTSRERSQAAGPWYLRQRHTDGADKIDQSRLTPEQVESLTLHHKLGAAAFIMVSVGLENFYRVPWEVWRDMKQIYGRKHMKLEDLEPYRVQYIAGILKLLEGVEIDYTEEGGTP